MYRWLITWVVTDRNERHTYVMEVYEGDFWENAVVQKLATHQHDRSYPNWCVVSVQPMAGRGIIPADELANQLA